MYDVYPLTRAVQKSGHANILNMTFIEYEMSHQKENIAHCQQTHATINNKSRSQSSKL